MLLSASMKFCIGSRKVLGPTTSFLLVPVVRKGAKLLCCLNLRCFILDIFCNIHEARRATQFQIPAKRTHEDDVTFANESEDRGAKQGQVQKMHLGLGDPL